MTKQKRIKEIESAQPNFFGGAIEDSTTYYDIKWLIKELRKSWRREEIYKEVLDDTVPWLENENGEIHIPENTEHLDQIFLTAIYCHKAIKQAEEVE